MTFRATRMYYNGAYTGTLQEIGVKTDEAGSQPLVFKHSYRERSGLQTGCRDATPLNHLCDLLTVQISRRMAESIGRGESVAWTPAMRISGRGVEVVNRAGAADEVEWDRIARVDVERGIFRLWEEGVDKPRRPGSRRRLELLPRLCPNPPAPSGTARDPRHASAGASCGSGRRAVRLVGRDGQYSDRVYADCERQRRIDALVLPGDAGGAEGVGRPRLVLAGARARHRTDDRPHQHFQQGHA